MFLDLDTRSLTSAAMTPRANRAEVRNPVLTLPCAQRVNEMPPESRAWLMAFLQDLRKEARRRAAESLKRHKAPLYLYWTVCAVWSGHLAKVLRGTAPAQEGR